MVTHNIVAINGTQRDWTRNRYVLWFGACGNTRLMVWANGIDAAIDECVDWIVDNAPGLLCDDALTEQYNHAIAEGRTEDEALDIALADTISAGNAGNYLRSWEWGVVAENPTRADVLEMQGRTL